MENDSRCRVLQQEKYLLLLREQSRHSAYVERLNPKKKRPAPDAAQRTTPRSASRTFRSSPRASRTRPRDPPPPEETTTDAESAEEEAPTLEEETERTTLDGHFARCEGMSETMYFNDLKKHIGVYCDSDQTSNDNFRVKRRRSRFSRTPRAKTVFRRRASLLSAFASTPRFAELNYENLGLVAMASEVLTFLDEYRPHEDWLGCVEV